MKQNPIKFYYLRYNILDVVAMIDNCPDITDFVFSNICTDGDGYMQLISHGRMFVPPTQYKYSAFTTVLQPYRDQAFLVNGEVIMSNNYITIADMKTLIGYQNGESTNPHGFLLFTPALTETNYLYYNVVAYTSVSNSDTEVNTGDPTVPTNPSPPATMTK